MFWKKWFQHRPMPSEAQLRFMFRLGKEVGQQQQNSQFPPARPVLLCPVHHCQLFQAQKPEQGGYWMYCRECQQQQSTPLDTNWLLNLKVGTLLHRYNVEKRITEGLQHTCEQRVTSSEDAFLNDIVESTPTLLTPIIIKKDRRGA